MGRHLAVLTAVVAVAVSGCGLRPAETPLAESDGECPPVDRREPTELEVGVILELEDFGAMHVRCEVA